MGTINLPKSPVVFYAEKQGARVFTNSQMRENKGMKQVIDIIVKEETDRVIRHLKGKLPASLPQAEGKGGLKEKISGYILRNFLDMIDLYLPEDEDGKKTGSRLNSRNITELLISAGGAFQFNTGGPEKPSAAGLPGTNDLERQTNNMLRQKTEIGAFISCENNCSVIKCSFSDNAIKPKTVTDVNLSVNVPDSALINPFFRYVAAADCLIREAICGRLIESINIEIAGMENLGGGQESGESPAGEISGNDLVERIIGNENGTDDAAAHYGGNIDGNPAIEAIRDTGFTETVNALFSILDGAKLGYQFVENCKGGREVAIREYEDTVAAGLPDERYRIRLRYFYRERLSNERKAYNEELARFEKDVQHLWDLLEVIYQDSKSIFKVNDFEDLARKNRSRMKGRPEDTAAGAASGPPDLNSLRAKLARMRERLGNMYDFLNPVERQVAEDRLSWLENEYLRFEGMIDPHRIEPGLVLDLEITSIKRKRTTLESMAEVLNEFLKKAPECFQNAANNMLKN